MDLNENKIREFRAMAGRYMNDGRDIGVMLDATLNEYEKLRKVVDDAQYLARRRRWPLVQGVLDQAVTPEKSGLSDSEGVQND